MMEMILLRFHEASFSNFYQKIMHLLVPIIMVTTFGKVLESLRELEVEDFVVQEVAHVQREEGASNGLAGLKCH